MTFPSSDPSPVATTLERRELDRTLVRGLAWTGAAKWGSQILTWGATIFVARLLRPEDYGLVGMATVYLGLMHLVTEFGFGTTIVILRELSRGQVAQLNTLAVALGIASFLLSFAAAQPLAQFFGAPELTMIVIAMSGAFIVDSFRAVPQALLRKDLQFRLLAGIEVAQSVIRAEIMVGLALAGFGYWTLVLGNVLGASIWTFSVLMIQRHPFAMPGRSILPAVTFSWRTLASHFAWYLYSNADFVVVGRMLGKSALGAYSFAWTLASMPVEKITALIGSVTPSVFSAVQSDHAALRRYLLTLTEGLALITFPATIGLALVANTFVPLVLGDHWEGAIAPMQLLALYASFRSISPLLPQILNVTRQNRFGMWNNVLAAIVLPIGFYVGARWGTVGIATAWICLHPLVTFPVYWKVFRQIQLSVRQYLWALWSAGSAVVLMALAVWVVKTAEPSDWPMLGRLAAEVGTGAMTYVIAIWLLYRNRLYAFRQVMALLRT